ncbi:MAG TPA: ABC transporter permease [Clostridiales bacterium]|nr:ABC transporter permease [Clostridiales bacterium]
MKQRIQHIMKLSAGDRIFDGFNTAFMILFMFSCLYPFYYIFIYSISDPIQASKGVLFWPLEPTLANYIAVTSIRGIGKAVLVSIGRTVIGSALMVFCSSLLGYLVSRESMPLRKVVYRFFVITMYFSAGLIPVFILFKTLGLYNSFFVYIIPGAVAVFNMILVKTSIEQLPASLEESAKLDGAGYFLIFRKIIFPLCLPIVATIALFGAVGQWNSWSDTLIFTTNKDLRSLQYVLYQLLKEASNIAKEALEGKKIRTTPAAVKMTVTMVVTIPILLVYPFMQRYFVKGIMIGAIKG